ncbi:MAG: bifunctional 5,10-methylenetetrahydrofolate dehydrogenase/5,10-methenyltetrahydrofolate cyclohydrolase [bacterium]|nr:bifunctional 5,10-methylenetetrahydrofolate dehydrogenase/5,10-methenyltetrahydrofolate cyclohydrolase [bacterium]
MINGIEIAAKIIAELKTRKVPTKALAAILVGEDKASLSFLKQKEKVAKELGVRFVLHILPDTLAQGELERQVRAISADQSVGAVIVQIPLPKKYDRIPVLNAIGIEKDVDVLNGETTKVLPPAVGALKCILDEVQFDLVGKRAVVVGPGLLIGRPVANWLMDKVIKLTVLGRARLDEEVIREADLVVTGTGVPHLLNDSHIKSNAVVIDFGYGQLDGKIVGDVDTKAVAIKTKLFTPTPGGTGPIVVAQLFENFFQICG